MLELGIVVYLITGNGWNCLERAAVQTVPAPELLTVRRSWASGEIFFSFCPFWFLWITIHFCYVHFQRCPPTSDNGLHESTFLLKHPVHYEIVKGIHDHVSFWCLSWLVTWTHGHIWGSFFKATNQSGWRMSPSMGIMIVCHLLCLNTRCLKGLIQTWRQVSVCLSLTLIFLWGQEEGWCSNMKWLTWLMLLCIASQGV